MDKRHFGDLYFGYSYFGGLLVSSQSSSKYPWCTYMALTCFHPGLMVIGCSYRNPG